MYYLNFTLCLTNGSSIVGSHVSCGFTKSLPQACHQYHKSVGLQNKPDSDWTKVNIGYAAI